MIMSTSLYLQCVAMYILGQALHIFLIKIPAVRKRSKTANVSFSWKEYWKEDWNIILANVALGAMLIIGLDQVIKWKPDILKVVKWFFGTFGFSGSAIILSKWSSYEKKLQNVIDVKSNIADSM